MLDLVRGTEKSETIILYSGLKEPPGHSERQTAGPAIMTQCVISTVMGEIQALRWPREQTLTQLGRGQGGASQKSLVFPEVLESPEKVPMHPDINNFPWSSQCLTPHSMSITDLINCLS